MWVFKKLAMCSIACICFSTSAIADEAVIKLYPDNPVNGKTNPVSVSFSGSIYKDKPLLNFKSPNNSKLSIAELALIKFIEVNSKGTPEQVLDMWNPPERGSIKEILSKGDIFTRNKALYSSIVESRFVARVNYGSFVLFYVEQKRLPSDYKVKMYPFIEKDGQYFASNMLTSDFFYSRIASDLEQYFVKNRIEK